MENREIILNEEEKQFLAAAKIFYEDLKEFHEQDAKELLHSSFGNFNTVTTHTVTGFTDRNTI